MSIQADRCFTDTLRTLAYTGISASYAAVGTPLTYISRMIRIINNSNGDMFFSDDGVNDKWYVPASSFVLYDYTTNALMYSAHTQIYVRQSTAATAGTVAIESTYSLTVVANAISNIQSN